MKAFLLATVFMFLTGASVFAQRWAVYDREYILNHMPDYISAQKKLDALSKKWQADADNRNAEIEKLNKAFQAEQILLTEEMRKRRQIEIDDKVKDARDFYNSKFGYQKELFQQNIKLTNPIYEKVRKAIQAVAESLQLDALLDKNQLAMSYIGPRLDKSDDIIRRLGYKPGDLIEK